MNLGTLHSSIFGGYVCHVHRVMKLMEELFKCRKVWVFDVGREF